MSSWAEKRTTALNAEIVPDPGEPADNASSSSTAATSSGGSKFPLRKIGDLLRNKLRSSGSYSVKSLNESIVQECKIVEKPALPNDVENVPPTPTASAPVPTTHTHTHSHSHSQTKTQTKANHPTTHSAAVGQTAEVTNPIAVVVAVNEKPFRAPPSTATGDDGSGIVIAGTGSTASGSGIRSRKMGTFNRTMQRPKSAISSSSIDRISQIRQSTGDDSVLAAGGVHKRQSISSQGTSSVGIDPEVVVDKTLGRDRLNSTSHYSTEKSGSSGYYSTNIYFAGGSVVDEHIYYEPVDRGRKPSTDGRGSVSKPIVRTLDKKEGILKNGKSGTVAKSGQKNGRALEKYYFPATLENLSNDVTIMRAKRTSNEKLTDIVESSDGTIPKPIWPMDADDSLADINLEAFRMRNNSQQNLIGFESPASSHTDNELYAINKKLNDETTSEQQKSQYEEYLEFHNTRNILEQIRGKLNTLLEQRIENQKTNSANGRGPAKPSPAEIELENKIANLKSDLESYLQSMNQKNENEIKNFCRGMSKDAKVLAVQNAVEHRNRSRSSSVNLENEYDVLKVPRGVIQPFYSSSVHQRTLKSYPKVERSSDDPHPSHFETVYVEDGFDVRQLTRPAPNPFAQEARTAQMLTYQRPQHQHQHQHQPQPIYEQHRGGERRPSKVTLEIPTESKASSIRSGLARSVIRDNGAGIGIISDGGISVDKSQQWHHLGQQLANSRNLGKAGDVSDFTLQRVILMESLGKNGKRFNDKEKMLLEYHLNKPSYWELYYGANREEQTLPTHTLIRKVKLGAKNAIAVSYPSTRPESDFTLDLPRAEQLRVKMKKEKQLRSRCRWIFYLLSVVFFLLSVMVVSLVLTRGKRMFGSMI
ncbi:uncharacterized protein LOC129753982 [Uranotaenia lowii]|uniref:uncharacterized protein LOC129753982 n=1 Tax=Uranotaenia lowii TaxID=190385 RepID=UPI0024796C7F|nr:uncharacterized protein LOC129753982 [Uranotaenia lowii]XP_055605812.1 uncharacterized protein LOC129753982 [Uranotaenia lowii]XP_055605813.1 uncharacterized protein LOC129753982 [Uranotaenia lowii]